MVCFVMHCEDATIQDSTSVDLALEYEYQETSVYIADLVLRVLRLKSCKVNMDEFLASSLPDLHLNRDGIWFCYFSIVLYGVF